MEYKEMTTIITAFAALLSAVIAVLKHLSRRDKQISVQTAFRTVVDSLSSEVEGQRLGGAILLRRFFDPKTELGSGKMPYAREAVDVIAAILREAETGNFQKLLADGLLYAPSLEFADLQRTNLQNAYLGIKGNGTVPNMRRADFYRADLSGASLKGTDASGAVFYQARLHKTIFKQADLSGASFFEANLLGANFEGAKLTNASFIRARNIPSSLIPQIREDGTYIGPDFFTSGDQAGESVRLRVFISKPGTLTVRQQELLREVMTLLEEENLEIATVERKDYPKVGVISEVRRVLSGCHGVVVLGFRQLEVSKGIWRSGTEEAKDAEGMALPTTWNHVEAGMAAMAGLPMLFLVENGISGGLFELGDVGYTVFNLDLSKLNHDELCRSVETWCHSVRASSN